MKRRLNIRKKNVYGRTSELHHARHESLQAGGKNDVAGENGVKEISNRKCETVDKPKAFQQRGKATKNQQ